MVSKCSVTQANEGLRTTYIRYTLWTFVLRRGHQLIVVRQFGRATQAEKV